MSICSSSNIHVIHVTKRHKLISSELDDQSSKHDKIPWPKTIPSSKNIVNNIKGVIPLLSSHFPPITSVMSSFLDSFSSKFMINPRYPPFVDPKIVLQGNFSPVEETPPTECFVVEGKLPLSLNGVYIRNGPNPQYYPRGPHHLFEGDGMLHSVKLCDGRAIFCNRYVKTYKYKLEHEAGAPMIVSIMSGFHGLADLGRFIGCIRDNIIGKIRVDGGFGTSNTSVASFYGRVFAMMESDLPYEIELTENGDIVTKGRYDFNKSAPFNICAHPKIDVESGELFSFQCFPIFPYLNLFCFDDSGSMQKHIPMLCLKHPIYVHDFAITKKYLVFQDIQIEMDSLNLLRCKGMPVTCRPTKVPRLGVISRHAITDSDMRWFKAPGFNAFHILNAWEDDDDDTITIIAPNLLLPHKLFGKLDECHFSLEKLKVNLKTGMVSRILLSDKSLELGSINPAYQGKKNRFVYMGISEGIPKMSGVVKIDLELGREVASRSYGPYIFGGEVLFVARRDDKSVECCDEDDGYLLTYIHDEKNIESNFVLMDAKSENLEILVTIRLPSRVPYGFHGLFVRDCKGNGVATI